MVFRGKKNFPKFENQTKNTIERYLQAQGHAQSFGANINR